MLRKNSIGRFIVDSYQRDFNSDEECEDTTPASPQLSESQRDQIVQVVIEHLRVNTEK